jgi:hypothetical protein
MISQQATGQSQSDPQTQASTLDPLRTGPEALGPKGITPIIGVTLTELVTTYDDIPHQQTVFKSGNLVTPRPAAEPLLNTIAPGCKLTDGTLQIRYAVPPPATSELHLHPPEMPNLANDPHAAELLAWLMKSGFIVQKLAHAALLILFAIITACSSVLDDADANDDDDDDAEESFVPHHHRRPGFHLSTLPRYTAPTNPLIH